MSMSEIYIVSVVNENHLPFIAKFASMDLKTLAQIE